NLGSDGSMVKLGSDGSMVKLGSDGSMVKLESQGSMVKLESQGSMVKLESQGSMVKLDYSANNLVALEINESTASLLRGSPQILSVELDEKRQLLSIDDNRASDLSITQVTPYAVSQSQADQLQLQPGIKVCVIDSGLDNANPDFDYSMITGSGWWGIDRDSHGTHLAGIIAAMDNGIGVKGIAPSISMHIVKVFDAAGWAYSSDLTAAIDECSDAGANILSMSFGGKRVSPIEKIAIERFVSQGGLAIAAAGNEGGNARYYPAGYRAVMMVGANDADKQVASFSQHPHCTPDVFDRGENCVEVTAAGVDYFSTLPTLASLSLAGAEYKAGYSAQSFVDGEALRTLSISKSGEDFIQGATYFIDGSQPIDEQTYAQADGRICVIDRKKLGVSQMIRQCQNNGALAAVVINNEPGLFDASLNNDYDITIAVVTAKLEDRATWINASNATITIANSPYGIKSGTSMAAPVVAAVAALVWSNFPHCKAAEIRKVLRFTAADIGPQGKDNASGYGSVRAKNAYDHIDKNGCAVTN
ncbi:MAG: S8 family serine peptidase, partial [Algicola sp.]|nr:S8 family serine peptidase [Algicola sp.]